MTPLLLALVQTCALIAALLVLMAAASIVMSGLATALASLSMSIVHEIIWGNIMKSRPIFIATVLIGLFALFGCQQQSKGVVRINTEPGGAAITIDGKPKGNTPTNAGQFLTISLPKGQYIIEALLPVDNETEKYAQKDIFIAADTIQTLDLELESRLTPAEILAAKNRKNCSRETRNSA